MCLQGTSPKLTELAISTLWNLAFRSEANRSQLGMLGGVAPLAGILTKASPGLKQQAARLLASVIFQHPENHAQAVTSGVIPPLVAMLSGDDADKAGGPPALASLCCTLAWSLCPRT